MIAKRVAAAQRGGVMDVLHWALPALTGVISGVFGGIIAPLFRTHFEESSQKRRMEFEASLTRQTKVIDDQAEFLDALGKALWDWRYTAMQVTYYGVLGEQVPYEAAQVSYRAKIWDSLNRIRFCASRARRLISEVSYSRIVSFYSKIVEFDKKLAVVTLETDTRRRSSSLLNLMGKYSQK
jgi:hypothetical protein